MVDFSAILDHHTQASQFIIHAIIDWRIGLNFLKFPGRWHRHQLPKADSRSHEADE
jgi:hypothetical protein